MSRWVVMRLDHGSARAVAAAYNCGLSTAYRHERAGTLDKLAKTRRARRNWWQGAQKRSVPTTVRGVTYPSRAAAARALGISSSGSLTRAERRGTLDNAGLGPRPKAASRRPVTIRGITYASHLLAARVLGVNPSAISTAKRRGNLDVMARNAMKRAARRRLEAAAVSARIAGRRAAWAMEAA